MTHKTNKRKTLRQQINAVRRASLLYDLTPTELQALLDVKSTLLSIQLIGEKRIQLLPELIAAAKGVLPEFDSHVDQVNAFSKLEKILKQMGA